jgi:hypothetical protein
MDFLKKTCENMLDLHGFSYQRILIEYKSSLVVQMFEEQITHVFAKANLELLCDIEVFLSLPSMLECI